MRDISWTGSVLHCFWSFWVLVPFYNNIGHYLSSIELLNVWYLSVMDCFPLAKSFWILYLFSIFILLVSTLPQQLVFYLVFVTLISNMLNLCCLYFYSLPLQLLERTTFTIPLNGTRVRYVCMTVITLCSSVE